MKNQPIAMILVAAVLGGTGGFLISRTFPAHHYEPLKESGLLYDTATGKLCDPFKAYHGGSLNNVNVPPCE